MVQTGKEIPRPEYPRPDWRREGWLNLNGTWSFQFDEKDSGMDEKWFAGKCGGFDREITVPFSWASPLSGIGEDKKGVAWYRRTVAWQPGEKDSRVFLVFGAVDYRCDIWVNGVHMGNHAGGYSPFEFEVTHLWNSQSENEIVVRAEDWDHAYQTRGKQGYGEIRGIWQPVWLEARPKNYITNARFVTHLDGRIELAGKVHASSTGASNLKLIFQENITCSVPLSLVEGLNDFSLSFTVENPRLWSPEDPYLYEGVLELEDSSSCAWKDRVHTYFGIREIGYAFFEGRDYPWITLNGKPVFLNGTLDQSFNPEGYFTYPSDEEMRKEIWRLKRLGLNFVRIHIKPEEPRKLYWADRLGVLVMEDMPCFWGEPDEEARGHYEQEAEEVILRDINHPAIISWVMFNETWGLFTKGEGEQREYRKETQEWVHNIYHWAKKLDPTRLVEDNSPCNYDHVESDLNTWHFYLNGYQTVREHIQTVVNNTYPGSDWNYVQGHQQGNAPLMNSECGAVWGVEGSAGDSDIAWHYHYMLNEYRRHEKLCGFIFTEFHDVVNEFNGYYRIDGRDKDFGYEWFCPGMSVRDLHNPDFVVIDAPPCTTVKSGQEIHVPLLASSFSEKYHGQVLNIQWELWYDSLGHRVVAQKGTIPADWKGYGTFPLPSLSLTMPQCDSVAVLAITLQDKDRGVVARNFTTFDVQSGGTGGMYETEGLWLNIPPCSYASAQWEYTWKALGDHKVNGGGSGYFEYQVSLPEEWTACSVGNMEIIFEAAAKIVLYKDKEMLKKGPEGLDYMHGAKADPAMNINSYFMTDEQKQATWLEVWIDGQRMDSLLIPDDPADSRGVLSWHYQSNDRRLEEAGSYGYLQKVRIPSRVIPGILKKRSFTLRLQVPDGLPEEMGGLALYGRKAGRYPIDILVRGW